MRVAGSKQRALERLAVILDIRAVTKRSLDGACNHYDGPLWIMRDGDIVILPAGGGMERRNTLR